MKKYLSLFLIVFLIGCSNDKKESRTGLEKVKALCENAEYNAGKQILDELKTKYPHSPEIQKEILLLRRQIDWKEQERNLAFCDSLIPVRQSEVDSLRQYFVFEKDPEYDSAGRYIEKKAAGSLSSQQIQTGVNETGDIYLKSTYAGTGPIRHNQLRVSGSSGEYAQTEAIPFDGGANYTFKDDNTGLIHETVAYQNGRDNGVIQFIYSHSDEKLTVSYLGGKTYSIVLTRGETAALVQCVNFSAGLTELQKLHREKAKAEERIKYLRTKL